jgi:predicted nucleic acid-binding protein
MSTKENSDNPFRYRSYHIERFFKYAAVFVDESNMKQAVDLARGICAAGIKPKDALHVACAVIGKSDCFLTTDRRLLKCGTDAIT